LQHLYLLYRDVNEKNEIFYNSTNKKTRNHENIQSYAEPYFKKTPQKINQKSVHRHLKQKKRHKYTPRQIPEITAALGDGRIDR
jgi:hypothetical protein